eukprot:1458527-Prymnesium_polylepis.1
MGTIIHAADAAQPRLFTIFKGAPPVHISHLQLHGTLRVQGSHLVIRDCGIESTPNPYNEQPGETALSIVGGIVRLVQAVLKGHKLTVPTPSPVGSRPRVRGRNRRMRVSQRREPGTTGGWDGGR